jgi:hypothetical protein
MHQDPAHQDLPAEPAICHVPWLQPITSVLSRILERLVEMSVIYAQAMHPLHFRTETDKPDHARAEDPPRHAQGRPREDKERL